MLAVSGDEVPRIARRSRTERTSIAAADAGFAVTAAMGIMAVVVSIWRPSDAALIALLSLAAAATVATFWRGVRSYAEVHGDVLRLHRVGVRSIPIEEIGDIAEAHRYRRVSTTMLSVASGRVVRTKAVTAEQVRKLVSQHSFGET